MNTMAQYSVDPSEITSEIRSLPITFEPVEAPGKGVITPADTELMNDCFYEAQRGTSYAIRTLRRLVRKYPGVPSLKNRLTVAYMEAGKKQEARKLTRQVLDDHPDYLFGRLNNASFLLSKPEKLHKIPELLGETLRLRDLQPDTEAFHFFEIRCITTSSLSFISRMAVRNWQRPFTRNWSRSLATTIQVSNSCGLKLRIVT